MIMQTRGWPDGDDILSTILIRNGVKAAAARFLRSHKPVFKKHISGCVGFVSTVGETILYGQQYRERIGIPTPVAIPAIVQNKTAPKKVVVEKPVARLGLVTVRFDGGTHKRGKYCPHGSWKIDDHPIQRIEFNQDFTSDECELHTALCAVKQAAKIVIPESTDLAIFGDSVNAITRCEVRLKRTDKRSEYQDTAHELYELCHTFRSVFAQWKPRSQSVRLFGH